MVSVAWVGRVSKKCLKIVGITIFCDQYILGALGTDWGVICEKADFARAVRLGILLRKH